jgi:acetyl esterase/lipase
LRAGTHAEIFRTMKVLRLLRHLLIAFAAIILLALLCVGGVWLYFHPHVEVTKGVVYGHRQGQDLTLDVLRPAHPNGIGIVLMASGGWKSEAGSFRHWIAAPILRRGYTVFAVYHIAQPKATVMEITEEVYRAVRFIRHNAAQYGVDPQRLGVTGGSSGGHLSLMIATKGGPGDANATDPVDRESSAIQAVAIFYPPTDLLNLGDSTENLHDGGPPKSFVHAFGPTTTNLAAWKVIGHEMSPIYFINSNLPPSLIYHGDADKLVTMDQSQRFQAEAKKQGCNVELVIHHGGKHGWLSMPLDLRQFANWFDRYLRQRTA